MSAVDRPPRTAVRLEEAGLGEAIVASASPSAPRIASCATAEPAPAGARAVAAAAPAELAQLMDEYLHDSLAAGRAAATVAYRRVYLEQLLAWLEDRGIARARLVTSRVLSDYLVHLKTRRTSYNRARPTQLSVKTLAAEVSVLRSLFSWLTRRRVVLFDPMEDLRLGDRTSPLPKAVLTETEMEALLAAPGTDAVGLRDRAILETLYSTGLRRAEACALDLYDLDQAGELVRVRRGKGGRDRYVPIGRCALAALRRYLAEARPELVASLREPALFVAAVTHQRINVKTLNLLVRKHAENAGIGKRVTPHVLRHTCATHLLRGGADIRHVQAILGHASVATTQIYTRVAAEDLAVVHRRCHPRRRLRVP
jgi:integrase/recombinase XerD